MLLNSGIAEVSGEFLTQSAGLGVLLPFVIGVSQFSSMDVRTAYIG